MRISPVWISRKTKGFTFVELLIVMLLLSIFVTFASVNWNVVKKTGKENLLEAFSIEVALIREDAVSMYEDRMIEFDITNSKVRVGYMDLKRGFVGTRDILVQADYLVKDVMINGTPYSQGKALMNFYASGMVDRIVVHANKDSDYYTLLVNPLTAKVSGENGYIEEITVKGRNNPS
jgi:prepilin-type N-terminal cleavage/methylation domain-containing protein